MTTHWLTGQPLEPRTWEPVFYGYRLARDHEVATVHTITAAGIALVGVAPTIAQLHHLGADLERIQLNGRYTSPGLPIPPIRSRWGGPHLTELYIDEAPNG